LNCHRQGKGYQRIKIRSSRGKGRPSIFATKRTKGPVDAKKRKLNAVAGEEDTIANRAVRGNRTKRICVCPIGGEDSDVRGSVKRGERGFDFGERGMGKSGNQHRKVTMTTKKAEETPQLLFVKRKGKKREGNEHFSTYSKERGQSQGKGTGTTTLFHERKEEKEKRKSLTSGERPLSWQRKKNGEKRCN